MKTRKTLTALLLFAVLRSAAFADVVSLAPQKDNTLYEDGKGFLSNGHGIYFFAGRTAAPSLRRGLIAFDLTSIPTNATITAVSLSLFLSKTHGGSASVSLSKVSQAWGEGASDAGEPGGNGANSGAKRCHLASHLLRHQLLDQFRGRFFRYFQREHDSQRGQHDLHVERERIGRRCAGLGFQSSDQFWLGHSRQRNQQRKSASGLTLAKTRVIRRS